MIVTGSVIGGTPTKWGIYLNNTGAPLGAEVQPATPITSSPIAVYAHAIAYLSGGNKMGFAFVGYPQVGGGELTISMKLIGN